MYASHHALQYSGLDDFATPDGCAPRAVQADEVRMRHPKHGFYVLFNRATQTWKRRLPPLALIPLLALCLDQCSIGYSAGFFLMHFMSLCIILINDPFHRDWNDIRGALRATPGHLWRSVVHLSFLFHLSYKPIKTSDYHRVKQEHWKAMFKDATPSTPWFANNLEGICKDVCVIIVSGYKKDYHTRKHLFSEIHICMLIFEIG